MASRSRRTRQRDTDPMAMALGYLARCDRTEAQLTAFLVRKGLQAARIQPILRRLRGLGYLNDDAYARRWAAARVARQPMGRARLEAELSAKGLDRSVVLNTIEEVYRDLREPDLARMLMRRDRRGLKGATLAQRVRRLRGRGFSEEIIEEVLGS